MYICMYIGNAGDAVPPGVLPPGTPTPPWKQPLHGDERDLCQCTTTSSTALAAGVAVALPGPPPRRCPSSMIIGLI